MGVYCPDLVLLHVLRHPDFRYLFLGQSASAVGDQVVIVALALYITQRTGSATDLGLVLAAQSVLVLALIPRSTRELSGERSAQHLAGDVGVETGRETQITDVDPLVGVVHKRRGLE